MASIGGALGGRGGGGANEIKLVYASAEAMSQAFNKGGEQLQDISQEMQNLANTLQSTALKGTGGDAFVDAIRNKLCPSLAKFIDKFKELDGDVKEAIKLMKEADEASKGKF